MLQVALQPNNQVALPESIVRQANLHHNDTFYIHYEHNEIKLIKVQNKANAPKTSIMDFLGCAKSLYGNSPQEIDDYLTNERLSWEK